MANYGKSHATFWLNLRRSDISHKAVCFWDYKFITHAEDQLWIFSSLYCWNPLRQENKFPHSDPCNEKWKFKSFVAEEFA
jgi:hypothetical protein